MPDYPELTQARSGWRYEPEPDGLIAASLDHRVELLELELALAKDLSAILPC